MPTNVYFSSKHRPEQNLYEDLVIESLKMYGQDVMYLPRQLVTRDDILNEDYSKFTDAYTIEMYIETSDAFGGEGDLLGKFGLEIRDQATFVVSRRRWEQLVGIWNNSINSVRPTEGDLIYLPMSNSLFEVRFVEHEQPFYQLQNLPVYKLQCELYEYGGEEIETGIDEIDAIEQMGSLNYRSLTVNTPGTDFIVGERVTQDTGLTVGGESVYIEAEVAGYTRSSPTSILTIIDERGTDGEDRKFFNSATYTVDGDTSGASAVISAVSNVQYDTQADNDDFEIAGDSIIDFTEINPFGRPGDL